VVTRQAAANPRPLPPNVFSNHLPRQTGSLDQARAMPHVARFVEKLPAGEPIALYTLGLDGLHIVQDFTTDTERLQRALAAHRLRGAANRDGPTERRSSGVAAFSEMSANLMERIHDFLTSQRSVLELSL
jgi:hypothetical protein